MSSRVFVFPMNHAFLPCSPLFCTSPGVRCPRGRVCVVHHPRNSFSHSIQANSTPVLMFTVLVWKRGASSKFPKGTIIHMWKHRIHVPPKSLHCVGTLTLDVAATGPFGFQRNANSHLPLRLQSWSHVHLSGLKNTLFLPFPRAIVTT